MNTDSSRNRRYTSSDMAKIYCEKCNGCGDCCHGMTDTIHLDPYDIYLLCSDGLTDMVSTEEICSILKGTSFENAADKMLNRALEGGGKDNITILLCMVEKKKSLFSRLWRGTDDTADR